MAEFADFKEADQHVNFRSFQRGAMINLNLLSEGWYNLESGAQGNWVWSQDIAYINVKNISNLRIGFFIASFPDRTNLQPVKFWRGKEVLFAASLAPGAYTIEVECDGAAELKVEAEPRQLLDVKIPDNRVFGIGLFELDDTNNSVVLKDRDSERACGNSLTNALPINLQIEVSTACHLSCVMCSRSQKTGGKSQYIRSEVWNNFFTGAKYAQSVNFLGLGEPWTHPDFLAYLRELDAAGVETSITTAGDLINDERASVLGEMKHLRDLTFSIDSPDPDIYKSIRGQELHRTEGGLRLAASKLSRSGVVRLHAVLMKENFDSIIGFPDFCKKHGVKRVVMRGVVQMNSTCRELLPEYSESDKRLILEVVKSLEDLNVRVDLLPTLPEDIIKIVSKDFIQENDKKRFLDNESAEKVGATRTKRCMDPWEKVFVTKDGEVYPCECYHLQKPVGSLGRDDLSKIWNGVAFRELRRSLLENTNLGCRSCERRAWGFHPLELFAAELIEFEGRPGATCRIRVKNVGKLPWSEAAPLRLGTVRPRDRVGSAYYMDSWCSPNRLAQQSEASVRPGEIATLAFDLGMPPLGAQAEYAQLIIEHQCWLPNIVFRLSAEQALTTFDQ